MTTETVHPNIAKYMAEYEAELKRWQTEPGVVHVTCVVELRDGVPRKVLALGGHRKDRCI